MSQQDKVNIPAETTDLHPSGLTWEQWNWPFKMPYERRLAQEWLYRKDGKDVLDDSIPF